MLAIHVLWLSRVVYLSVLVLFPLQSHLILYIAIFGVVIGILLFLMLIIFLPLLMIIHVSHGFF